MRIDVSRSVDEDYRIKQLTTAGAFPGFKGANKIIILLSVHTALATWTLHNITLPRR